MKVWKVTFAPGDEKTFAADDFEALFRMIVGGRYVTKIVKCGEIIVPDPEDRDSLLPDDRMDAWGLIANAYGGDWNNAPLVWREAAVRWRDTYMGGKPTPTLSRPPDTGGDFDNDLQGRL